MEPPSERQVILVDKDDRALGACDKQSAHLEGKLHRAFSIFLFNREGHWLLQQRAGSKYHSGGLWSNTCCSHPMPGEDTEEAAHHRLGMEMGIDCPLTRVFGFLYKAELDQDLVEHEYDHVFTGTFEGAPQPNPDEVKDWRWVNEKNLTREISDHPSHFTYWFRHCYQRVLARIAATR